MNASKKNNPAAETELADIKRKLFQMRTSGNIDHMEALRLEERRIELWGQIGRPPNQVVPTKRGYKKANNC